MIMWSFFILALILLADGLRTRRRAAALQTLKASDEEVSPEHRFITAPGVVLDAATKRAASAFARATGARVLDLVPGDLPAHRAFAFLGTLDPAAYRRDKLGKGRTAGHAVLVHAEVLERACSSEPGAAAPSDTIGFVRLVGRLKPFAPTATDLVVAPSLRSVAEEQRAAVVREVTGMDFAVGTTLLLIAALAYGAFAAGPGGIAALAAFHLAPLVGLSFGPLRSKHLVAYALFREPAEIWSWFALLLERWPSNDVRTLEALHADYNHQIALGLDRFFEPRLTRCPICASEALEVHLRAPDLFQCKPGEFTLERCRDCSHIFQNPRLSIEGLSFYYRDFYDGLGDSTMGMLFGSAEGLYEARARTVEGIAEPARWLDVGGGHGHFCLAARKIWPGTKFDALDLSNSIEDAHRRGWVDQGYRGLFPDLAPSLEGSYDVVSMSHYLEHTRDPRAEIEAADKVLPPGGLLLVEVPNPAFSIGRLLGRLWLPWFQPQHQHFLTIENLTRLLEERDFKLVQTQVAEAHQRLDFLFGFGLILQWLVPPVYAPWVGPASVFRRALRSIVFTLGAPLIALGFAIDQLIGPIVERLGSSNTYRILARKHA